MGKKSEYQIGFTGLTDGQHRFTFEIEKPFFEQLEYSEINDASLIVQMALEKKPTIMTAEFEIEGKVNVMCDRCTDYFDIQIKGKSTLIYKFGDEDMDDENVVTVYPNETEINVVHPIYEFTVLLLPARRVHPDGKCNQAMLQDIDKYLMVEDSTNDKISEKDQINEDVDPRWAALQKLKNNNKNKK